MAALGTLKNVDPRIVWKHEEKDFTPWVAENIGSLCDVIGVIFTVDQIEKRVGSYELDIFGHLEGSDAPVIIENQLAATDHRHLGQLITYAAGLEAALIIWIATDVTDEHRAAILWLNKVTGDEVSFFLVRPEVMQIDESKPAVKFVLEAAPSEFKRVLREAVQGAETPRHDFRRGFWAALLQYLAEHKHGWAADRSTTKDHYISSRIGRGGVSVNVSMAMKSRMRVEIYFPNDVDKTFFNAISVHKQDVEMMLPHEQVSWEPLEDTKASRIAVYRHYAKDAVADDTTERRELFAWIDKNLVVLRDIARKYLNDVAAGSGHVV